MIYTITDYTLHIILYALYAIHKMINGTLYRDISPPGIFTTL